MSISKLTAKHFREVYFGGNWTTVNLKSTLEDVTWKEATKQVHDFNTIAILANHINYYVKAVQNVLQGQQLQAKDEFSFKHHTIQSQKDWKEMLNQIWIDGENFVRLIEKLPEEKLNQDFTHPKYGNFYRNLHGIIEHTHYHLGQIILIKKMIAQENKN
ncbi:DinB family protein [Lacinutrix iliipiscaria]|uniref:DinB family protein n=1 Tax=Lacinutrix iliipiscaria TaxID=1230532 RepID=A0ABW5WNR8_9FLAO